MYRYRRYHLETSLAPDIVRTPSRFRVKVRKHRLARLLLEELVHYRVNTRVVLSRPCVYGVFSGPVGGFAPREHLCVGCLRCTTQYPEIIEISHNPERGRLGDSYFTPAHVDGVYYEARTGRIPVKGAGYRGPFGGEGWDGMWTDISEIVRPTRDGIHGREFISTAVDIGSKPPFLTVDEQGRPIGGTPRTFSVPIPLLLDTPPASLMSGNLLRILTAAAREAQTLLVLPARAIKTFEVGDSAVVPLVTREDLDALGDLRVEPPMVELATPDEEVAREIRRRFPQSLTCVRLERPSGDEVLELARSGIRVFHLAADYHGRGRDGRFILEVIREAHRTLVEAGRRDEVTLLASGGIIAAEHVAKAIVCGADAVVLDTPLLVALQAQLVGECADRDTSRFRLPDGIAVEWGVRRIRNLMASWRDQLLEVLGAMGLREARRLRGEMGRAMFQKDLEHEAFSGIAGYGR